MDENTFEAIYGGSYVGHLVEAMLVGFLTVLMFKYYEIYPKDPVGLKAMIAFLWLLQVLQLALFTYAVHWYLVSSWLVPPAVLPLRLVTIIWQYYVYQPISVVTSFIVQTFFTRRIYAMSENIWLFLMVQGLALLQLAVGIFDAVALHLHPNFVQFKEHYSRLTILWLASEALADTTIAVIMCILLSRRRTGFRSTNKLINRLMLYSIHTGTITSVLSFIVLGGFVAQGFSFFVSVFTLPFSSVYVLAMMLNLHTRARLGQISRSTGSRTDNSFPLSSISRSGATEISGTTAAEVAPPSSQEGPSGLMT